MTLQSDLAAHCMKLEQENEKLRAQLARMRATLSECAEYFNWTQHSDLLTKVACALDGSNNESDAWMKEQKAKWLGEVTQPHIEMCMLPPDSVNASSWCDGVHAAFNELRRMASELRSPESDVDQDTRMA